MLELLKHFIFTIFIDGANMVHKIELTACDGYLCEIRIPVT